MTDELDEILDKLAHVQPAYRYFAEADNVSADLKNQVANKRQILVERFVEWARARDAWNIATGGPKADWAAREAV